MKKQENQKQEQVQITRPVQKRTRKIKAQNSKTSKSSYHTRRRQQPDSSQQNLLPTQIPKSNGTQSVVSTGYQNQLTKTVIRIPFLMFASQTLESLNIIQVQNQQVIVKITKQHDNVTVSGRSMKISKPKMQIQQNNKQNGIGELNQQNLNEQQEQNLQVVNFWGKYVYLAHFECQNKVIKKIRKQLNTVQDGEIIKFKVKQVNSDMLVYLNLRLEEKVSDQYNGLINQGNTCYMNSYLQTLYHIPAFRNLVYEAQIQDQSKFPATLQDLFFNLCQSQRAVSPQMLVKSFGWGRRQASIQQDAQQFSCLFFQVLQRKLSQSGPKKGYKNRTIQVLFKGQLNHYLRCTQVVGTQFFNTDFRRQNYEQFIDLQLPIYPTLQQSLDAYTSEVHMEGDNRYRTEEHGLQQAYKGVRIAYFPPILMIQLKRFEYSFQLERNIKILAQLEYQEEFDFSKWSSSGEKQLYELYAVLVHQGAKAQSGHYYNFVKSKGNWYKFNDEIVQLVSKDKVFKYNFGGFHQSVDLDAKQMKVSPRFVESKTTAYMLVYVKKSLKQELMCDEDFFPEWIKNKNSFKLQQEEIKKNRKNFFHNVGIIDWERQLEGKNCSDMGFLDCSILQKSKKIIQKIPKQAKISEWLASQSLIEQIPMQKGKKPVKGQRMQQQKRQVGIYVYYVTPQRQNLTGFICKPQHAMQDLLKIIPDPIIFKAPFQVKKQEYLAIIKRFKVEKIGNSVELKFFYEAVLPVAKQIRYPQLYSLLRNRFTQAEESQVEGQQQRQLTQRFNLYIDDHKLGPINISEYSGSVPLPIPNKNQLLVCVVEQLPLSLTIQEELKYSYTKWYQNKKDTINLFVAQQRSLQFIELRQIHINLTLSELRQMIFKEVLGQNKKEYESSQNIVLKAKLKKASKNYNQVAEPQYSTLKDLIRFENKIQFGFSSLSVESRLSQYQLNFYYRSKQFQYSDSFQIIVQRNQQNQKLVQRIKNHQRIIQLLRIDGVSEEKAEIVLFSKDRMIINDIVTNQGKVYAKGQLDVVLKRQKNAVLVVELPTIISLQKQPRVQIKEQDVQPTVNILLHNVSQSIERVGTPRYLKVDRRMQLFQLKNQILDLIKDQYYGWEGKVYSCNPFKTRIILYVKDNKKVVQLTDLQSLDEIKRLRIQERSTNQPSLRKKSKQIKYSACKQTYLQEIKQTDIQKKDHVQNNENGAQVQNGKNGPRVQNSGNGTHVQNNDLQTQKQDQKLFQNQNLGNSGSQIKINVNFQNGNQEMVIVKGQQQENDQPPQQQEVTKIQGPQTIYGVFPKVKILKMQIIHNYLTRPNIVLRLNVDD